jgi:hypothetical protein
MFAAAGLAYPELLDLLVTDALAGRAPMISAASRRLEARLRYGFQCRARSATSAGSGR